MISVRTCSLNGSVEKLKMANNTDGSRLKILFTECFVDYLEALHRGPEK